MLFPTASGDRCGIAPLMPRGRSGAEGWLHGIETRFAVCRRYAAIGTRTQTYDPTLSRCVPCLSASTPNRSFRGQVMSMPGRSVAPRGFSLCSDGVERGVDRLDLVSGEGGFVSAAGGVCGVLWVRWSCFGWGR